jgi:N-acetylglucosamine kinase-like BadF-type ATPase
MICWRRTELIYPILFIDRGKKEKMPQYFMGIDVGSSKTHALVVDDKGVIKGFGESGPGNQESVGFSGLKEVLTEAIGRALDQAHLNMSSIVSTGLGLSGYDWISEDEDFRKTFFDAGIHEPFRFVNDALIGVMAGSDRGWGVSVVGGTGCNAWGWNEEGQAGRMSGYGDWFGEGAGAGEIVNEALKCISRQWTMLGPETLLTPEFIKVTHETSIESFLESVGKRKIELDADYAPIVFDVARKGDKCAQAIIRWAGRQLGNLAVGVIKQLHLQQKDFDVILIGSLFEGGSMLTTPLRQVIHRAAPKAHLIRLYSPPVIGAVIMSMKLSGLNPLPDRKIMVENTRKYIMER